MVDSKILIQFLSTFIKGNIHNLTFVCRNKQPFLGTRGTSHSPWSMSQLWAGMDLTWGLVSTRLFCFGVQSHESHCRATSILSWPCITPATCCCDRRGRTEEAIMAKDQVSERCHLWNSDYHSKHENWLHEMFISQLLTLLDFWGQTLALASAYPFGADTDFTQTKAQDAAPSSPCPSAEVHP